MGVQTDSNTKSSSSSTRGNNNAAAPSEEELTKLFETAMHQSNQSDSSSKSHTPLTQQEQQRFLSAMKDPEFRSLLNDYMQEISDPANRAETEQYLTQLEQEQKVPSDKLLVRPVPGFVVKVKWYGDNGAGNNTSEKVFINICSSDKLQPPSSTSVAASAGGKGGTSWHLPYSIGPERVEKDKSGGTLVPTFDMCVHTKTLEMAMTQRAFRDMVVKIALDAIEKLLRKSRKESKGALTHDYHVLKGVAYKSGQPVTMCLKNSIEKEEKSDESTLQQKKSKTSAQSTLDVTKAKRSVGADVSSKDKVIDVKISDQSKSPPSGSLEMLQTESTTNSPPLIQEVSTSKRKSSNSTKEDKKKKITYQMIYRGKFELSHHMQAEFNNQVPAEHSRPKELVLEMEFPDHTSAAGMDLDVSEETVKLVTKGYEPLEIKLPFHVYETKGTAKFDKKTKKLVVTLPVQPPPPPKRKSMSLVVQEEEETIEEEDGSTPQENNAHDNQHDVEECFRTTNSQQQHEQTMEANPAQRQMRKEDGFQMLRETALMVANDPLYLPQHQSEPVDAPLVSSPQLQKEEVYDDLPPLESCSEEEVEKDEPKQKSTANVATEAFPTLVPLAEPPFTLKETPTCLSYIIEVPGIDSSSVQLKFPSATSLSLQFIAKKRNDGSEKEAKKQDAENYNQYQLTVTELKETVDTDAEVDVATENMVVILRKKQNATTEAKSQSNLLREKITPADVSTVQIEPVMRFQNQLLYELD